MEYCVVRLNLASAPNNWELTSISASRVEKQGVDRLLGHSANSPVDALQAFVQLVGQHLSQGWEPAGGLVAIGEGEREQALVKRA